MSPVTRLVLATVLACAGVWFMVTGAMQRRPALAKVAAHLARGAPVAEAGSRVRDVGAAIARRVDPPANVLVELRLAGRTSEVHALYVFAAALGGFVALPATIVAAQAFAIVSVSWVVPLGAALLAGFVAPLAVHSAMRSRAAEARRDLRYQLSAYLDVVTMLLAGNLGNEGALRQAAQAGDGRFFAELRRRIAVAETSGRSLVTALAQLGDDLGLVELQQISASAALASSAGAPVARTLAAKCATLRGALSAEQEADARVRTGKITIPLVGMSLLIMAAVIYPALNFSR
jgi:Flp pilus assembly protein TadB